MKRQPLRSAAVPRAPAAVAEARATATRRWYAAAIVVAATLAYSSSFAGQFVFDDVNYVARNPHVHQLWPPHWIWFCPARPLVYFTFAVNYVLGGLDPFGYHAVNLAIHLAAALLLFGIVRRTLALPHLDETLRLHADAAAALVALLWAVHPLGTQAVTYVYQRLESLAAMLALASLYAFVRAQVPGAANVRHWLIASVAACYAAMISKEAVFALPLLIAAYDRLYVADSWRQVLARRGYYAALFGSWALLAGLMLCSTGDYNKGGIGNVEQLTPLRYALSQSGVLLHYLRLSILPIGLCIDYGWPTARSWPQFVPQTIVIVAALGATFVGFLRRRAWSFPALAFFFLLAPSSSIIPIIDLVFEHRMYLPLACVLVLLVCGGIVLRARLLTNIAPERRRAVDRTLVGLVGAAALALGVGTWTRNFAYHDLVTMWHDVVAKAPQNPRGYYMLAIDRFRENDREAGKRFVEQALQVDPEYPPAKFSRCECLIEDGNLVEAEALLQGMTPLRIDRASYETVVGLLRTAQHRRDEAEQAFRRALGFDDRFSGAYTNLGLLLYEAGRRDEAAALYRRAIECDFNAAAARNNLGIYYAESKRDQEAVAEFRQAIALNAFDAKARANLGSALDRLGRGEEALQQLQLSVEIDPRGLGGWIGLGNAMARRGRYADAVACFEQAHTVAPDDPTARQNLAQARQDLAAAQKNTATPAVP
jgi:tetratricopeptide (TPR) repeat protein